MTVFFLLIQLTVRDNKYFYIKEIIILNYMESHVSIYANVRQYKNL